MARKTLAKFIAQLFELLEDDKNRIIALWDDNGKSVIIHNEFLFSKVCYLKHNKFSSFVRQLSLHGF